MADSEFEREPRYRAFISYSHKNAAFGRRLHRWLEGYMLPRRLVGRPGRLGQVPSRLSPIFRDREELSAADDLSVEVRQALATSACLIVVCSPEGANSPWVSQEIETFRQLHPRRPVLAALVKGEPDAAFPLALKAGIGEPLAADFRRQGDGTRLAYLKLASALAGVELDALVQRDAQRQVGRIMTLSAMAVSATLVMAAVTVMALQAQAEARRQRAESERLVEFMLTDLRDRLKGVSRLDIMEAVNDQALTHYARQGLKGFDSAALVRRARVLHAMGEDDLALGHPDKAIAKFEEARRATSALLAKHPNDPVMIFGHAQSEFWVARSQYEAKQFTLARAGFRRYLALAQQLTKIDPANFAFRREVGFAEGNLCSIAFKPPRDPRGALTHCWAALDNMRQAAGSSNEPTLLADMASRYAWLADAYWLNEDRAQAKRWRLVEGEILAKQIAADPRDARFRDLHIAQQRALAGLAREGGDLSEARSRILEALSEVDALIAIEPRNAERLSQRSDLRAELAKLSTISSRG